MSTLSCAPCITDHRRESEETDGMIVIDLLSPCASDGQSNYDTDPLSIGACVRESRQCLSTRPLLSVNVMDKGGNNKVERCILTLVSSSEGNLVWNWHTVPFV